MKKFAVFDGTHGMTCMLDPDKVIAIAAIPVQGTAPASVIATEQGGFMAEVLGTPEEIYEKLVQAGRLH
jgi:hypothetical protein